MNVFNLPRLAKASVKTWLKPSYEFKKFVTLCIWACGAGEFTSSFELLRDRILKLIKNSGLPGTYNYLKEVLRLVIRFLAGQAELNSYQKGRVAVRCDSRGLPTIIPWRLREIILQFDAKAPNVTNMRLIVCILTCLSIFRVFNVFPKASLKSVITAFDGIGLVLPQEEINKAIQELPFGNLTLRAPRLLVLETASPNASKSTWGAVLDAAVFLAYPRACFRLFLYNWRYARNGWLWNAWILAIMLASIPLGIFIFLLGGVQTLYVGKLGVVKDQAGKSRIVGITNYWIQLALKPLHDAIFRNLKNVPMDGTHNQEAPLTALLEKCPQGTVFHSFDLSAATDRLPLEVQMQVLDYLISNLGSDWGLLMKSLVWNYKGKDYRYAVGQPMGAYSSWAMLALTHHVLVQVAALRAGKSQFTLYAILGDDIVIADDAVASEYLLIMEYLGVAINLSKSIQSDRFIEFAKRWVGPRGVKLTPIGPGLLLRTIRNKFYLPALFSEMFKLGLVSTFQELLATIQNLPYQGQKWNVLWAAFGLNSFLSSSGPIDANAIMWCFQAYRTDPGFVRYNIWNALLQDKLDYIRESLVTLDSNVLYFVQNFWRIQVSRTWPNRMLEFCLKLLSPGPWAYFFEFVRTKLDLENELAKPSGSGSWSNIHDLVKDNKAINVNTIDWRKKEEIRLSIERAAKIRRTYDESSQDFFAMDESGGFY